MNQQTNEIEISNGQIILQQIGQMKSNGFPLRAMLGAKKAQYGENYALLHCAKNTLIKVLLTADDLYTVTAFKGRFLDKIYETSGIYVDQLGNILDKIVNEGLKNWIL